jgi:hypothetical protein
MRDPRSQKHANADSASAKSTNQKKSDALGPRTKETKASALKRSSIDGSNLKGIDINADGTSTPGSTANEEGGVATTEKRKVKFSSEKPNVVTVTREIKSEKLANREAERARSEEAMFDIDEEGDGESAPPKASKSSATVTSAFNTKLDRNFPTDLKTDTDTHHPEVVLSFQMPSPVTNRKTKFEYTMAKSLPAGSVLHANRAPRAPALGLHAEGLEEEINIRASTSLRAQNDDLKRMMAGQTPSHRSAWAAGEFFKSNATRKGKGAEEDEDESQDENNDDDEGEEEEGEGNTLKTRGSFKFLENNDHPTDPDPLSAYPAPSTSVPIGIPSIYHQGPSTDDNFEATMSRSVDPGPALDLMVGFRKPQGTNSDDEDEEDNSDDDREAKDLMRKMTEGRGSLHAQRILSHTERGIPAHMWRSIV